MGESSGETTPVPRATVQQGPYPQSKADADVINFGLGQPSPRLLPLSLLHDAAHRRLGPGGDPLQLQYGAIAGDEGFRSTVASMLSRRYRFDVAASGLMATGGISSALALVSQVFDRPGQAVVCSDPTYFLAKGIFESQGMPVVGIPVDDGGMRVDLLEHQLRHTGLRPSLVYCIPSFHNPCGVTLEPTRARRLVQLAESFDFVIVADEPYVMLHSGEVPPPCMMSYDAGTGRVLSLGSFSKILAPGLRLGWGHAEPTLIERMCGHGALRSGGGLNPVVGSLVADIIETGALERHIDHLRTTFEVRARVLTCALRAQLPALRFTAPAGGYFVWLELPEGHDASALLERARAKGVAFTAGTRCAVDLDLSRYLRLSFAFYEPHEIERGVQRLASALHDQ